MTFSVSEATRTGVFEVLKQDTNDVISIINFIIERGQSLPIKPDKHKKAKNTKREHDSIWDYI